MATLDTELPELRSATAARLLAAAHDLLLSRGARGFTVADVAKRAHVGKGTVYLYWPTKEDLLTGLIGRSFLGLLDDVIDRITHEPDLARPSRFCPLMLDAATGHPLLAALHREDDDLLGVLAHHPRSVSLHAALGPSAVIGAGLPIWRRHGLARTDWDLADQGFALHALVTGMANAVMHPDAGLPPVSDPLGVLADAVLALLGPESTRRGDIDSAASEVVHFLREGRAVALAALG